MDHQTPLMIMKPEDKIMLLCATVCMAPDRATILQTQLAAKVDWNYLIATAFRHGVTCLLYHNLKRHCAAAVPNQVLEILRNHYYGNSVQVHRMTQELLKILKLLNSHEIPGIPLKGPVLGEYAYGNTSLREFRDLDILVKKEQVIHVKNLLVAHGYREKTPLSAYVEAIHLQAGKDFALWRPDSGVVLDLQWQLVEQVVSFHLSYAQLWQRLGSTRLAGEDVLSLSLEDTLLFLCLHGGKHLWQKLIWIVDVAEFIRVSNKLDWPWLLQQAKKLGNQRMLLLGLYLAHEVSDTVLLPDIAQEIQQDQKVQSLATCVCKRLFASQADAPDIWDTTYFQIMTHERRRDLVKYLLYSVAAINPRDVQFLTLPKGLTFLYYFIRPLRQLITYLPWAFRRICHRFLR